MGASNIKGITIEIDGETTKLSKSLKDVDGQIKSTQTALRDVDKLLKLDPGNTELLTQKQKLLKDAIGETKDRLQQLKDAQGQVAQGTAEWDGLQREIIETEQKVKSLEDQYKSFGSVSAQQIKAAGENLKGVGEKVSAAGEAFEPVSAAAAGLVGGLGALGYKAVTAADDLNTLSKQTGISTDDLQKMQYASDLIDVSVDDIVGAMKKMKKNMDSDSKDVQAAWDKLGVSVRDASTGEMRSAIYVFYDTIAALSEVTNETERDQLAMDLFGKSADSLAGVIDDGGAALKDYGQQAQDMGLILSGDTLNSLNELNDTIDQTKATMGASMAELGASVATALQPALEALTPIIEKIAQSLREMDPSTVQMILKIGLVVAAIAPLLSAIGAVIGLIANIMIAAPALGAVIAALTGPIGVVIAAVAAIIAIGVALYKNWDVIKAKCAEFAANVSAKWGALKEYLVGRVRETVENVTQFWDNLKETVTTTVENLKQNVTTKWNNLKQTVTTTVENIKKTVTEKWENIKQTVTDKVENLKKTVTEKWENLKTTVANTVENLKKSAVEKFENIKKEVTEKVENVKKDVTEKFENIKKTITDAVTNAHQAVTEKIGGIKETIEEKIGDAVEYIKDLPGQALDWGRDLIGNFIDGIKEKARDVKEAISSVAEKVSDKMVYRHPHVFSTVEVADADEVSHNWEMLKTKEKGGNKRVLSGVPDSLPSILKAYFMQDKARGVGFDWEEKSQVWDKVKEEMGEYQAELDAMDAEDGHVEPSQFAPAEGSSEGFKAAYHRAEEELGDFLFAVINAARLYGLNPDTALNRACDKFRRRFTYLEEQTIRKGRMLTDMTLAEMDEIWDEGKAKGL